MELLHQGSRLSGLKGATHLSAQMSPFGAAAAEINQNAAAADGQQAAQEAGGEQSAFEQLAQSAAARVTGSAAAALAAARFKMLRSNTLAAAFGQPRPGDANEAGGGGGAPVNLLATRTKDERIISSTQSRPSAAAALHRQG